MKRGSRIAVLCLAGLVLATLLMWGCDDDECPVCPDPVISPSIENIWPNADRNWWHYQYSLRTWDQEPITFPTALDVPPAPSIETIDSLVGEHPIGPNAIVLDRRYRLYFDSLVTTQAGVTAQNLAQMITDPPPSLAPVQTASGEDALYLRILSARPDLRDGISRLVTLSGQRLIGELLDGTASSPQQIIDLGPILIHGGAWWKDAGWIGTYGDVETRLAWIFMHANFNRGHRFIYQLIPSLSSDVFLHGMVARTVNVSVPAGAFKGAVEMVYMIDFGVQEYDLVDPVRYTRMIDFGSVVYAPEYGPVYCYERNLVFVGADTLTAGYGDRTLMLLESNLVDMPVY